MERRSGGKGLGKTYVLDYAVGREGSRLVEVGELFNINLITCERVVFSGGGTGGGVGGDEDEGTIMQFAVRIIRQCPPKPGRDRLCCFWVNFLFCILISGKSFDETGEQTFLFLDIWSLVCVDIFWVDFNKIKEALMRVCPTLFSI